MRVTLTDTGGFVGVPLTYEVDVAALSEEDLLSLEDALVTDVKEESCSGNSAGATSVRMEREDGSVAESIMSHVGQPKEISELLGRLRANSKIVRML